MRVMVLWKEDQNSEAGVLPDQKFVDEMRQFSEDLVKAGVMLAAEGLYPSSKGVRVKFAGGKPSIIDGPFTETKELVAGFQLWQVKSMAEAVEWVKRLPKPAGVEEGEIEIRQVFEMDDFQRDLQAVGQ
jgi:hypothetical protein